jgi:hypothetical protein
METSRARARSIDLSRLTPERTMLVVTFVLVFGLGARLRIDTDVWWHLRSGAYLFDHGFIRSDPFSFTKAGESWIDHSWAAQAVWYALWRVGGYGALEVLTGVLALLGSVLVYRMCPGGTYLRCAATGLAAVTASIFWTPRPQMVTYALSAVVLYVLFLERRRRVDVMWLLPLVMLLWANAHAGFALGLLLIAGTVVGEVLESVVPHAEGAGIGRRAVGKLALIGVLSLGATLVNPYGPALLTVPFDIADGRAARLIEEWQPPDLRNASYWPFAILLALLILSIGASPKRVAWTDGLLCSGATLLALAASRNISFFAVVVTPVVADQLSALARERGWEIRTLRRATAPIVALNVVIIAFTVAITAQQLSLGFRDRTLERAERQSLPVDAVAYLREHPPRGHLFNAYDWGGYLIYALPSAPVFVDGRSDLYGGFIASPYATMTEASPGTDRLLDQYRIGTALVRRTSGIANALAQSGKWCWAYSDDLAVVFERRVGGRCL